MIYSSTQVLNKNDLFCVVRIKEGLFLVDWRRWNGLFKEEKKWKCIDNSFPLNPNTNTLLIKTAWESLNIIYTVK